MGPPLKTSSKRIGLEYYVTARCRRRRPSTPEHLKVSAGVNHSIARSLVPAVPERAEQAAPLRIERGRISLTPGPCPPIPDAIPVDSRILSRLRLPLGRFNTELLGVPGVQPLPGAELHGLGAYDAAHGSSAEKVIQNIETDVPPGSAH
jgi:hypothetical protein